MLYLFQFGLDITDEASYLLNLDKSDISSNLYNYGIFLKPHLLFSNYSIHFLRASNLIIIIISNLILSIAVYQFLRKNYKIETSIIYSLILYLTLSLSFYAWLWLPSPSYNTYNMIFCNIFFSIFLNSFDKKKFLDNKRYYIDILNIISLSFVNVCIFFSKSTTGLILFITINTYIVFFSNKKKLNKLLFSLTSTIIFFVVFVILYFEGLDIFIRKFLDGVKAFSYLEGHKVLKKPLEYTLHFLKQTMHIKIFLTLIVFSIYQRVLLKLNHHWFNNLLFFVFCLIFLDFDIKNFVAAVVIYQLYFVFFAFHKNKYSLKLNQNNLGLLVTLFAYIITVAFVFGSANNIMHQSFLVISILITPLYIYFLINSFKRYLLFFFLITTTYGITINITEKVKNPYRIYKPIYENSNEIKLNLNNKKIIIKTDKNTYQFIKKLENIFIKKNWNNKNYLIDLSGTTPVINLIIQSKILTPWIIGGNGGSENFILHYLKKLNIDDLKNSAIILSNTDRNISRDILKKVNLNMNETHYLTEIIDGPYLFNKNQYYIYLPNLYK